MSLLSSQDETLKRDLPKAANEVKASSNTLTAAVGRLKDKPTEADARLEQRRLIDGAKGERGSPRRSCTRTTDARVGRGRTCRHSAEHGQGARVHGRL